MDRENWQPRSAEKRLVACPLVLSVTTFLMLSLSARADGLFVEGGAGYGYVATSNTKYYDPVGTLFTTNPVDGFGVEPGNVSSAHSRLMGYFSAGYVLSPVELQLTYRCFVGGSTTLSGLTFGPGTFTQRMNALTHGVYVGIGREIVLGGGWSITPLMEVGAAITVASGTRDVGTDLEQTFSARTTMSFSYGAGTAVAKKLTEHLSARLLVNWDHLGTARTGESPDICCQSGEGLVLATSRGLPNVAWIAERQSQLSVSIGVRYAP